MNGNNSSRKKDVNVVQSVGDSWVLCRSKSRDGHVYYFNTLTGQTAWNLSNEEIEKSKNIKKQSSPELQANTPEEINKPTKVPMEFEIQSSKSTQQSGKQHNNQINNRGPTNQMHGFAFPGFVNIGAQVCDTTNNFNDLSSLNVMNPNLNNRLNSSMNPYNINTIPAIYNPNVWAVPPAQQIFIAPAVPPLVNQSQASLNVAYSNVPTQNIAAPVITNLGVTSLLTHNPTRDTILHQRINMSNTEQEKNDVNKYNVYKNDLRQKLSIKRNLQYNQGPSNMPEAHCYVRNTWQHTNQRFNKKNIFDGDEESQEQEYEDVSRLDLTPLLDLAAPNANPDVWYIVADEDVLLTEFKFLNILTDSDPQCRLMIPHHVMSHVENYVSNSQDVQARRILRFITQQIRHGDVMLAEQCYDSDDDGTTNMLLSTCFKLGEENYHLILLTMDDELLRHSDSIPVSIFSPENLKRLLKSNPNKSMFPNTKLTTFTPRRVAKNVSMKPELENNTPMLSTTSNKNTTLQREVTISPIITPKTSSRSVIGKSSTQIQSLKVTMDAAIQTDFNDLNPYKSSIVASDSINEDNKKIIQPANTKKGIDQNREKIQNKDICTTTSNKTQTQIGKRKICLKRSLSNQVLVTPSQSTEKRNFKWRRRRNALSQNDVKVTEDNNKTQNEKDLISNTFEENTTVDNLDQDNLIAKANISNASSDVSVINQNVRENIVIEETSTSGMISSTGSNIGDNVVNTIDQGDTPNQSTMYQVDNPGMEEYLKMKCDEWVSRFIQIMEEVLSAVLQLDPPFSHSSLPPPWTVHEATQCIKIKFRNNNFIKDAASKLSDIVFKVSDDKGNINVNIKPSEYMEMYSYGVHLLDILKVVVNDCEDLHIATESLKKLLNDIQNPNLECSTHETFFDVIPDQSINMKISSKEKEENNINSQSCYMNAEEQLTPQKKPKSKKEEKYNLRSNKKRTLFKNEAELIKSGKNWDTKSSFFSTLKLKKTINVGNDNVDPIKVNNEQIIKVIHNDLQKVEINLINTGDRNSSRACNIHGEHNSVSVEEDYSKKSDVPENNYNESIESEHTINKPDDVRSTHDVHDSNNTLESVVSIQKSSEDLDTSKHSVVNTPRIVRNFSKCAEFEERLRNKYKENDFHDESLLDYEDEYITEEYDSENYYEDTSNHEEEPTDEVVDEVNKMEIISPIGMDTCPNNINIKKFKYIVAMVLQEIRDAFCAIKTLCEKYFEESKKPLGSKMKKIELQVKAKRAHSHITSLCKSLDSMLSQETNDSNNNIQILLKKSGLDDFEINEDLKVDYSNTIAKCKKHAEVFLESIQNIITTLRC